MTARAVRPHDHDAREHGMRPLKPLVPLADALQACMDLAMPLARTERVTLAGALRRVSAEDIRAPFDVPLADRAAMDGYAVRAADTKRATKSRPVVLRFIGALFAGDVPRVKVSIATCVQIATGATIPPGADAVVMVEDTEADRDRIRVYRPSRSKQHISVRGSDLHRGEIVIAKDEILTPARLGAVAAIGRRSLRVFVQPKVALFTTGDEIVQPGRRIREGLVFDVNSHTLAAVVRENGGCPLYIGHASDDLDAIAALLRKALPADIVVVTGGSSVGTRDLLLDAFRAMGHVIFHGVAIRPGRPTLLARVRRTPVLGMPGNPTSCLNNAYVFLAPMIRRMAHLPPAVGTVVHATLSAPVEGPPDKVTFVTVRLDGGRAIPVYKESGAITSMSRADGYVVVPLGGMRLEEGSTVDVVRF